jgi:acetyl-CoA C-acetyltransferase
VIVAATRTPIGTFGGSLKDITANQLSPFIIDAVIKRAGIEKNLIDQVILGNCFEGVEHKMLRGSAL